MKFVQRDLGTTAEISSGGGGSGWRREVLLLGSALLGLTLALWFGIGWAVELALPLISPATEQKVFGSFAPGQTEAVANLPPEAQARFDRAATVLARLTSDPAAVPLKYRLFVMPGREPNAFAFPGGAIGVTRGLLEVLDDEAALAFVLGHELGHFAQRDHLRGIGRQFGRTLAWIVLFGGDGGELMSTHLSTLLDLRHSRHQELAADLFGLELVHRSYGTTHGTDRLFVWLEKRDRPGAWADMLHTHPAPIDRLSHLRAHSAQLALPQPR